MRRRTDPTFTNALVAALRVGLAELVDDETLRDRVDIMTVDAFAGRVLSTSRRPSRRRGAGPLAAGRPGRGLHREPAVPRPGVQARLPRPEPAHGRAVRSRRAQRAGQRAAWAARPPVWGAIGERRKHRRPRRRSQPAKPSSRHGSSSWSRTHVAVMPSGLPRLRHPRGSGRDPRTRVGMEGHRLTSGTKVVPESRHEHVQRSRSSVQEVSSSVAGAVC